jgi:hypothetical protein
VGNQQPAKGDQGAFAERGRLGLQAIEHQLPAPIHHRGLDHFIVRDAGVRLQDGRQRQLGGGDRRLPLRRLLIDLRQLGLKRGIEDGLAMVAQEHEQFGPPDLGHDGLLGRRQRDRRLPERGTHGRSTFHYTDTVAATHATTSSLYS